MMKDFSRRCELNKYLADWRKIDNFEKKKNIPEKQGKLRLWLFNCPFVLAVGRYKDLWTRKSRPFRPLSDRLSELNVSTQTAPLFLSLTILFDANDYVDVWIRCWTCVKSASRPHKNLRPSYCFRCDNRSFDSHLFFSALPQRSVRWQGSMVSSVFSGLSTERTTEEPLLVLSTLNLHDPS